MAVGLVEKLECLKLGEPKLTSHVESGTKDEPQKNDLRLPDLVDCSEIPITDLQSKMSETNGSNQVKSESDGTGSAGPDIATEADNGDRVLIERGPNPGGTKDCTGDKGECKKGSSESCCHLLPDPSDSCIDDKKDGIADLEQSFNNLNLKPAQQLTVTVRPESSAYDRYNESPEPSSSDSEHEDDEPALKFHEDRRERSSTQNDPDMAPDCESGKDPVCRGPPGIITAYGTETYDSSLLQSVIRGKRRGEGLEQPIKSSRPILPAVDAPSPSSKQPVLPVGVDQMCISEDGASGELPGPLNSSEQEVFIKQVLGGAETGSYGGACTTDIYSAKTPSPAQPGHEDPMQQGITDYGVINARAMLPLQVSQPTVVDGMMTYPQQNQALSPGNRLTHYDVNSPDSVSSPGQASFQQFQNISTAPIMNNAIQDVSLQNKTTASFPKGGNFPSLQVPEMSPGLPQPNCGDMNVNSPEQALGEQTLSSCMYSNVSQAATYTQRQTTIPPPVYTDPSVQHLYANQTTVPNTARLQATASPSMYSNTANGSAESELDTQLNNLKQIPSTWEDIQELTAPVTEPPMPEIPLTEIENIFSADNHGVQHFTGSTGKSVPPACPQKPKKPAGKTRSPPNSQKKRRSPPVPQAEHTPPPSPQQLKSKENELMRKLIPIRPAPQSSAGPVSPQLPVTIVTVPATTLPPAGLPLSPGQASVTNNTQPGPAVTIITNAAITTSLPHAIPSNMQQFSIPTNGNYPVVSSILTPGLLPASPGQVKQGNQLQQQPPITTHVNGVQQCGPQVVGSCNINEQQPSSTNKNTGYIPGSNPQPALPCYQQVPKTALQQLQSQHFNPQQFANQGIPQFDDHRSLLFGNHAISQIADQRNPQFGDPVNPLSGNQQAKSDKITPMQHATGHIMAPSQPPNYPKVSKDQQQYTGQRAPVSNNQYVQNQQNTPMNGLPTSQSRQQQQLQQQQQNLNGIPDSYHHQNSARLSTTIPTNQQQQPQQRQSTNMTSISSSQNQFTKCDVPASHSQQNGASVSHSTSTPPTAKPEPTAPQKQPASSQKSITGQHKAKIMAARQLAGMSDEDLIRKDSDGDTIFHIAVVQGDKTLTFMELALKRCYKSPSQDMKNVINEVESNCQTPVLTATICNSVEHVRLLVKYGANVMKQGFTSSQSGVKLFRGPIHYAAAKGQRWLECLKALVSAPTLTDINQLDTDGFSPLHLAVNAHREQLRYFLPMEDGSNGQQSYSEPIDSLDSIQVLLDKGANMSLQDNRAGRTIMHYAIAKKDMTLIKFLFERVPQGQLRELLNKADNTGHTCLHMATGQKDMEKDEHIQLIRLLMAKGADPSLKNNEHKNARACIILHDRNHKQAITDVLQGNITVAQ